MSFPPACPFVPLLAPRDCLRPGSTAFISLSPALVCLLATGDGAPASHQQVGAAGMTVHQAWNRAAAGVLAESEASRGAEFWVRDSRTRLGGGFARGVEVRGSAAGWLAHPKLFSVLHAHFTGVLRPAGELVYLTPDYRTLFIVDDASGPLPDVGGHNAKIRHSVGFPLLSVPSVRGTTRVA